MSILVKNSNYSCEVLENILTLATTGNEIVKKGLMMMVPGIANSKGDFNYDDKSLDPVDFMAFTVFNHRAFEYIWRPYQPKGNMVFRELPASETQA